MPLAEDEARNLLERSADVAALRQRPDRQREAIVVRYYADLCEAEIAASMGISRGAVQSHSARGMAALRRHGTEAIVTCPLTSVKTASRPAPGPEYPS